MKKGILALSIVVLIIAASCNQYDAKGNLIKSYDEIQKVNWLLGNWEQKDSTGILKEIWESQDDSSFTGQSYFIQNEKDTLHNEQMELTQDGKHLLYTATVIGENNDQGVPFQMTKNEDSVVVFENPKHDYPQKIQYQLLKNGSLLATVSGKERGKPSTTKYLMQKKK